MKNHDAYGFPPVGRCIYCGATNRSLTKEHIIGRGIGGTTTLHKASCAAPHGIKSKNRPKTCSEIARDIEQFCFRNMRGHFRRRIGLPSSERLTTLPMTVIEDTTGRMLQTIDVPIADHPAMFVVPRFRAPPTILSGLPAAAFEAWSYISNPDAIEKSDGVDGPCDGIERARMRSLEL